MLQENDFEKGVFINCPYDEEYRSFLRPLLFTIIYLGYNPRIALERSDSLELRLPKIAQLIRASRYSIHDLSRLQAESEGEYYRLNMSFELGIDYGSRLYGSNQLSEKKCLIVENSPFDYTRALSDLAGVDIKSYAGEPETLVRQVRNWFIETVGLRGVPAPSRIWYSFSDFMSDFYDEREAEGFSKDDLAWMPVVEFMDFIREWLGES